jgi:hypothetical protein
MKSPIQAQRDGTCKRGKSVYQATQKRGNVGTSDGATRDDSLPLQAEGFWNDAGVSSHTIRSGRRTPVSSRSKQLVYRMARFLNSVALLPLALRQGTHRNALLLKKC